MEGLGHYHFVGATGRDTADPYEIFTRKDTGGEFMMDAQFQHPKRITMSLDFEFATSIRKDGEPDALDRGDARAARTPGERMTPHRT